VGGFRPTSGWELGETIEDSHAVRLGPEIPAGEYRLLVGLYGVVDGVRLPIVGEGAAGQADALELGGVTVLEPGD
jgi:hypothetical protein